MALTVNQMRTQEQLKRDICLLAKCVGERESVTVLKNEDTDKYVTIQYGEYLGVMRDGKIISFINRNVFPHDTPDASSSMTIEEMTDKCMNMATSIGLDMVGYRIKRAKYAFSNLFVVEFENEKSNEVNFTLENDGTVVYMDCFTHHEVGLMPCLTI